MADTSFAFRVSGLCMTVICALVGCDVHSTVPTTPSGTREGSSRTISVTGRVYDVGLHPIAGATVEVMDAVAPVASVATNADGNFSFPAVQVTATVTIRASKAGFETGMAVWRQVTGVVAHLNAFLSQTEAATLPLGDYVLTVPAPECGLPDDLSTQVLSATVSAQSEHRGAFFAEVRSAMPWLETIFFGIVDGRPSASEESYVWWEPGGFQYFELEVPSAVNGTLDGSATHIALSLPFALRYCQLSSARPAGRSCFEVPVAQVIKRSFCLGTLTLAHTTNHVP